MGTLKSFSVVSILTQVKRNLTSSIRNFLQEMSQELPSDLRIRILGNRNILGKSQNCIATQPNAQSLLQNKFLTLALKIYAKTDTKVFQFCLTSLDLLIFLETFCTGL